MYLIVGLGNPGMKYKSTYHNIGFMVVDTIAKKFKLRFSVDKKCLSHVAVGEVGGVKFALAKPDTFMNLSGNAVKALISKYRVSVADELIVICDDADLPLGRTRLREDGSGGTHNGMRNIVAVLGSTDFKRVKVGIKNDELAEKRVELLDLVLSKIDYADKLLLNDSIALVASEVVEIVKGKDLQRVEEVLNRKK